VRTLKYVTAGELLLISPALIFMSALFLRSVQPILRTGLVVDWFSQHLVLGLYISLVAMPLGALVVGCVALAHGWRSDAEFRRATLAMRRTACAYAPHLSLAAAMLVAVAVLALVALHMITE
jgi:hypothetical protein